MGFECPARGARWLTRERMPTRRGDWARLQRFRLTGGNGGKCFVWGRHQQVVVLCAVAGGSDAEMVEQHAIRVRSDELSAGGKHVVVVQHGQSRKRLDVGNVEPLATEQSQGRHHRLQIGNLRSGRLGQGVGARRRILANISGVGPGRHSRQGHSRSPTVPMRRDALYIIFRPDGISYATSSFRSAVRTYRGNGSVGTIAARALVTVVA